MEHVEDDEEDWAGLVRVEWGSFDGRGFGGDAQTRGSDGLSERGLVSVGVCAGTGREGITRFGADAGRTPKKPARVGRVRVGAGSVFERVSLAAHPPLLSSFLSDAPCLFSGPCPPPSVRLPPLRTDTAHPPLMSARL